MELDLGISGDGGGAASDSPSTSAAGMEPTPAAPSATESALAAEPQPLATPGTITDGAPAPAAADPTAQPGAAVTDDGTKPELTEEELESQRDALLNDPNVPDKYKNIARQGWAVAGKRKESLGSLQSEFDNLKTQFEGKEILPPEEIERLRAAEDTWLGLTSFTAKPEDILGKIKEANPRVYGQLLTKAAWDALETPEGKPDLNNLQAVIDRFSEGYGSNKVQAKDVLQAIEAIASGKIDAGDLQMFKTPEEQEQWERTRAREQEIERTNAEAKANRDFTEKQTRSMFLTQEQARIQQSFREPVFKAIETFKLMPVEGEPKVSADFKAGLLQEVGLMVRHLSAQNGQLNEAGSILQKLGEPAGLDAQSIQSEIQQVLASPGYSLRLNRGMSDIQSQVEKFINQKAVQYKYMMMGYEAEAGKNPRPIPNAAGQQVSGQTEGLTEQQLSQMTAAQRTDYYARQASNQMRASRQSS